MVLSHLTGVRIPVALPLLPLRMTKPTNEDIVDGLRNGDARAAEIVRGWVSHGVNYVARGSKLSQDDLKELCSILRIWLSSISISHL